MQHWPTSIAINAWTGDSAAASELAPGAMDVARDPRHRPKPRTGGVLKVPEVSVTNWRHKEIGWGLILRDGSPIPAPLQALLDDRTGSPVLRYMPGNTNYHLTHLYHPAVGVDIPIAVGPSGIASPSSLPYYLLIYGTPEDVPWELQYRLNQQFYVGRLDLEGVALENYITSLINQWNNAGCDIEQALAWSVVQDVDGITKLMRSAIGEQVVAAWQQDTNPRFQRTFLDGAHTPATAARLIETLHTRKPALIVTTSHGRTGPLNQPEVMKERLGLLVDQHGSQLHPTQLLEAWEPDGAVWYAHACCSAGSSKHTQFDEQFRALIPAESPVDRVLKGVAGIGSCVAPLPRALLGAPKPLRAFVGHVEPTFDISLRDIGTGQYLTTLLKGVLYRDIYQGLPIGYAFQGWFSSGGLFNIPYEESFSAGQNNPDGLLIRLAYQLLHRDRTNTVILGDPTVALPPLP